MIVCGIYASVGLAPDRQRIEIVAHRGPDGDGWEVLGCAAGPVTLGHRRLAIIDLSEAALQPMADPSGRFRLIFNGEIYNYIELRSEMEARGEHFTTRSDSEVLLRAWMLWGEAALPRLRGMFAFAIWDTEKQQLVAARDRFGIKPLYLTRTANGVAFGSEIKQLLGLVGPPAMNLPRIFDFLAHGVSDHLSGTMFKDVEQVRGGEFVTVDASGPRLAVTVRCWHHPDRHGAMMDEASAAERFRDLFEDAVRVHLRSDVPVGSCLSGGLDSSSIVCMMARLLAADGHAAAVNTVSAVYPGLSVDETRYIDEVVRATGAHPHKIAPDPSDVFALASDITWHQDEPFGSTSIFAQWCVFAEARRAGVKVMLDGQGADEQLAGYHTGFAYHLAGALRRGEISDAWKTVCERRDRHGASLLSQGAMAATALLPRNMAGRLRAWRRDMAQNGWVGEGLRAEHARPRSAAELGGEALGLPPVRDLATLCLNMTYASNLPMLLHWEDRNSMAHSIEARVPFLDAPLVAFSLSLGNAHKMVGADTKRVLRRALHGHLPVAVRDRQDKLGFATPEEIWFRGPLRGMIEEGVEMTLRRYPELFNAAGVRRLRADMLDGRKPMNFLLWRIVNLGIWGDRFGVTA
jgi:asparagine synthase (glutamine-hydrolysing)